MKRFRPGRPPFIRPGLQIADIPCPGKYFPGIVFQSHRWYKIALLFDSNKRIVW